MNQKSVTQVKHEMLNDSDVAIVLCILFINYSLIRPSNVSKIHKYKTNQICKKYYKL